MCKKVAERGSYRYKGQMDRRTRIFMTLNDALQPTTLEVVDQSHQHAGHAGARAEGETHYHVTLATQAFAGKTRVQSHRMVHQLLAEEFEAGLHALTINIV
jgi:BolA protein